MKRIPIFLIILIPLIISPKILLTGYFCADNNLYNGFLNNYSQIVEASKILNNTDIFIFVDTPFYSYVIKIYDGKSETLKVMENINSGDPLNISDLFTTFYLKEYSLRIMILWDHGNGWYDFTKSKEKSIFFDNHPYDFLSITQKEFKTIFQTLYNRTLKKTDLLVFDACLMQTVEVLYEAKDFVDYFVGSESIIPYNGFPYDRILPKIDTLSDIEKISKVFVEEYFSHYSDSNYNISISSVKSSNIVKDLKGLSFKERKNFSIIDEFDVSIQLENSLILNFSNDEKYKGAKLFFPQDFSTFINLYEDYINLDLDKDFSIVKDQFLYFNIPDTFPPLPTAEINLVKGFDNNYFIEFKESYDFSGIKDYSIFHSNSYKIFQENFDTLPLTFSGESYLSDNKPFSGKYSLFSKNFFFETYLPDTVNILTFKYKGLLGDSTLKIYLDGKIVKLFKNEFCGWKSFYLKLNSGNLKIEFNEKNNPLYYIYLDDFKIFQIDKVSTTLLKKNSGTVHKISSGKNIIFIEPVDSLDNIGQPDSILEIYVQDSIKSYVFPNPAKDFIKIYSEYEGDYRFLIFTMDGKKTLEKSGIKNDDILSVNINDLKTGLYYYILKIDKKTVKGKFYVER